MNDARCCQISLNLAIKEFIKKYNLKPNLLVISKEDYKVLCDEMHIQTSRIFIPFYDARHNAKEINSPIYTQMEWSLGDDKLPTELKHPENVVVLDVKILRSTGFIVCIDN